MARNLIIGAIEGYRFEQIAPFFLTLRKVNYPGDIVIFHRKIDALCCQKLTDLGTRLIELPPGGFSNPVTGRKHQGQGRLGDVLSIARRAIAGVPAPREAKQEWALGFARRFFHIANLRFLLAERYLREHPGVYEHVMISDVRDVLFQLDPFAAGRLDRLTTFLESQPLTIETSKNYREWIEAAFGPAETEHFRGAKLSCCAITIGPEEGMLQYLSAMARLIGASYTRQPYLFGLDSAAHNYICVHRSVPALNLCENFEGPVAHLGLAKPETIRFNQSGRLINQSGEVIATVHQYDRHPEVMAALASPGWLQPLAD